MNVTTLVTISTAPCIATLSVSSAGGRRIGLGAASSGEMSGHAAVDGDRRSRLVECGKQERCLGQRADQFISGIEQGIGNQHQLYLFSLKPLEQLGRCRRGEHHDGAIGLRAEILVHHRSPRLDLPADLETEVLVDPRIAVEGDIGVARDLAADRGLLESGQQLGVLGPVADGQGVYQMRVERDRGQNLGANPRVEHVGQHLQALAGRAQIHVAFLVDGWGPAHR